LFELPAVRGAYEGATPGASTPKAEFCETDKSYEVNCELPGLTEKDVEVTIQNGLIEITGRKEARREEKDVKKNYHFSERSYGAFQRSFRLPEDIDEAGIAAHFENGLLTVTLPKTPAAMTQPKKISIAKR
jgi:HSP20 family protein